MNNVDKLTKVLLAIIAVAVCLIALNPWLHPVKIEARSDDWRSIFNTNQSGRYQFHNQEMLLEEF